MSAGAVASVPVSVLQNQTSFPMAGVMARRVIAAFSFYLFGRKYFIVPAISEIV
jgi:hypothetical protein